MLPTRDLSSHARSIEEKQADADTVRETARKRFAQDPDKAIKYLIEQSYFPGNGTAAEIAQFLHTTPNLSKAALGEYLGQHHALNLAVLYEFAQLQVFKREWMCVLCSG